MVITLFFLYVKVIYVFRKGIYFYIQDAEKYVPYLKQDEKLTVKTVSTVFIFLFIVCLQSHFLLILSCLDDKHVA